jgi:hypothetical protein
MMQDYEGQDRDIWVLTEVTMEEVSPEIRQYGALNKISPEKLAELLNRFVVLMGKTLGQVQQFSEEWDLEEITVSLALSGEVGLTLIAKAGAEGGIELTFRRR